MSQNKYYQPLDSEHNRRFTIKQQTKKAFIDWHIVEIKEPMITNWSGYIRVPTEGDYVFKMTVDDNGYVMMSIPTNNGDKEFKKILEVTGKNSAVSVQTVPIHLDSGFYYVEMHQENCIPDIDYDNATQFKLELNGTRIDFLYDMVIPSNRMTGPNAQHLVACYEPVCYNQEADAIWKMIGGDLKERTGGQGSCALRMSIALSNDGVDFKDISGSWDIKVPQNDILGKDSQGRNKQHVLVAALTMKSYLIDRFGVPDYAFYGAGEGYEPRIGDIVVYANSTHTGLTWNGNPAYGGGFTDNIWLLHRDTLDGIEN